MSDLDSHPGPLVGIGAQIDASGHTATVIGFTKTAVICKLPNRKHPITIDFEHIERAIFGSTDR